MSATARPMRELFTIARDGTLLRGVEERAGPLPLVFQHGLGASVTQVDETLGRLPGVRRLTLDCRAQGGSGAGMTRPFSIATFAGDVLAACDARGLDTFVAGGLSMGAAVALHLASHHPDRVRGLILARPAWGFEPAPANLAPHRALAAALRTTPDAAAARAAFLRSDAARRLRACEPASLTPLLALIDSADPAVTATLLADLAAGGAGVTRAEVGHLAVPTLVVGQRHDPLHPLGLADLLARAIPGARRVEVPPRRDHKAAHIVALRSAVAAFLRDLPAEPAGAAPPGRGIGPPVD